MAHWTVLFPYWRATTTTVHKTLSPSFYPTTLTTRYIGNDKRVLRFQTGLNRRILNLQGGYIMQVVGWVLNEIDACSVQYYGHHCGAHFNHAGSYAQSFSRVVCRGMIWLAVIHDILLWIVWIYAWQYGTIETIKFLFHFQVWLRCSNKIRVKQ